MIVISCVICRARGSPRQKVRRDTSGSRIAGQRQDGKPTTHQPPRESESRQTDRQTEQAATPTPIRHLSGRVPHPKIRRGAPVTTRTGPRTREAPLAVGCPPIRHLVVRVLEFEFGPSVLLSAHTGRVNTNQGFSAPKHDLESHNPVQ